MATPQRRVIHLVPYSHWSDVAKYSLDLCTGLGARGRSVTAYSCNAVAIDRPFVRSGVDLRHAPLMGLNDVATPIILARHLRHEARQTVIHTHRYRDAFCAILARRAALRLDIRVVISRHIPRPARDSLIYRYIYRHLDAQIFTSERGRREFLSTWEGKKIPLDTERLHVIPPSVPNAPVNPVPEPERGPMTVLYAGIPTPGCGVETLIDALPELRGRRIRFSIPFAADPDFTDAMRLRAEQRSCADMIDWRPEPYVSPAAIRSSHICILPSGRPNTFLDAELECLAAGRPAIAPGRDRSGWCVGIPADNPDALAKAVIQLASDPELRMKTGRHAFARFHSHHDWNAYLDMIADIYEKI